MRQLHIYGQADWHGDAFVIGDRKALELLRDCLNQVLGGSPNKTKAEFMVNDGEGYNLHIALLTDDEMDRMATPYTSDVAMDRRENAVQPEDIAYEQNS